MLKSYRLLPVLLSTVFLPACDQQLAQTGDTREYLSSLEGPKVSGVNQTMLDRARKAEEQGDFRSAQQTYEQLLDKDSSNKELAYAYAESLRKSGQAKQAESIYRELVRRNPDFQDAKEGLGLAELALGDIDSASATLSALMQINPNRWRTLNAIGILFAQKNLYPEAQQYFKAALMKLPNHPPILNNTGMTFALDRDFYSAQRHLQQGAQHARHPAEARHIALNQALVHAVAGDLNASQALAEKHLSGAALHNNMGFYARLSKDEALARTHLHSALSESKTHYEKAWQNLANMESGQAGNTDSNRVAPKRLKIQPEAVAPRPVIKPAISTIGVIKPVTPMPTVPSESSQAIVGPVLPKPITTMPVMPSNPVIPAPTVGASGALVIQPTASIPVPEKHNVDTKTNRQSSDGQGNGFDAFGDWIKNIAD